MTFHLIDRMVGPRELGGVDFGSKSTRVLIKRGDEYLLHAPGGNTWSGMHGTTYVTGGLYYVRDVNPRTSKTYRAICSCRLGSQMLHMQVVRDAIIELFGKAAYDLVRVDRTLVID